MIPLGPFDLLEPIASGGMGQVWRANHRTLNVPVAVKVVTATAARDQRAVQSFRNEMRALAGLSHDHVVHLFDHGEVDVDAAGASDGRLTEGSPYMAMEFASGGALGEHNAPTRWTVLRALLLSVLDGLAHAHSRGVIHRDLKPGNLLVCTEDDLRPGLKLTDFGIAHVVTSSLRAGNVEEIAGTLHYMSPEQVYGNWRDFGPWTDLYALGCLAYQLAAGHVPFAGFARNRLIVAQVRKEAPPLQPLFPVPEGYTDWVSKLMAKNRHERYACAADAAWALASLQAPDAVPPRPAIGDEGFEWSPDEGLPPAEPTTEVSIDADKARAIHARGPIALGDAIPIRPAPPEKDSTTRLFLPVGMHAVGDGPPLPRTWRRQEEQPLPLRMVGAGLRLYGVRTIPMVDRVEERDAIWAAVMQVHRTGNPRAVLLHGPAGTGKSRIVEWMCERALELGAATVLRAVHGPLTAPGESLLRMVERHLNTARLDRMATEQRVHDFLEHHGGAAPDLVFALTEFLCPHDGLDVAQIVDETLDEGEDEFTTTTTRLVRLQTAAERHMLLIRLLERISAERPVILVLEDVQWGEHALSLASMLIQSELPVLLLITARDEELAARPSEEARMGEVSASPRSVSLSLGPLAADDHIKLIEQLLTLDGAMAARIAERTAGNPLFAVELVGDWVQRGLFEVGHEGFVLRQGVSAELPDDLHAVWVMRIRRALEGLPNEARPYLERAAALGLEVDDEEWMEACDDPEGRYADAQGMGSGGLVFSPAGARVRSSLVNALLNARLATESSIGWSFTHQMVRESLERESREQGTWTVHNLACAQMLRRRARRGQTGVFERLGLHLVEANDLGHAIEPLMKGVDERSSVSGYRPALALLGTCEDVMKRVALPESDARWGEVSLARSRLCFLRSDHDESLAWAERALTAAQTHGWLEVAQEALFQRAQVALRRNDLPVAERDLNSLRDTVGEDYDPATTAKSLFGLAAVARYRHEFDDAYHLYGEACRYFTAAEHEEGTASCWRDMAAIELTLDNPERAEVLYRRALDVFETVGSRLQMANCINGFAEVARQMGDLAGAERGYRRALELYEQVGGGQTLVPRLNLGLIRIKQGQYEVAREAFHDARQLAAKRGRRHFEAAALIGLLTCAAGLRDWTPWRQNRKEAIELLKETRFAEPDTAWLAVTAGELALEAEERVPAMQAFKMARTLYRALDDRDKVAALTDKIEALG